MFQLDNPIFGSMSPSGGGSSDTDILQQVIDQSNNGNFLFYHTAANDLSILNKLDTSRLVRAFRMFANADNLTDLAELDFSEVGSVTDGSYGIFSIFEYAGKLTNFGGFKNLGKGYLTSVSANHNRYTFTLSDCTQLTEQSLINVLTKLYDINAKGCNTQSVVLGSTNMDKLTSSEGQAALESAINKGWAVS